MSDPPPPQDPPDDGVIDLQERRIVKLGEQIRTLTASMTAHQDERVAQILDLYHGWEAEHPELALKPKHKLPMVRLGFVGPGGFERCHEKGRLPETAFFAKDGSYHDHVPRDREGADVLMCPAMEAKRCEGVWAALKTPPCHLLLLEIYAGLGGGAVDDGVEEVFDDFGKWGPPDAYDESFRAADELIREHEV